MARAASSTETAPRSCILLRDALFDERSFEKERLGMNTRTLLVMALGTLALAGCTETIDSQNLKTAGIAALIRVTADSDQASTVVATLKAGGAQSNTYVDLGGGDRIFASAGGDRIEMQAQSTGVYEAKFNTAAADTEFIVDLQRETEDDAPASRGTLPAPFALTAGAATASRGEDITFTWTPSGLNDDMRLELNGSCIFLETIDVPGDMGTHTIPANTLKATGPMDAPPTCDITVEMTRVRKGQNDAIFDSESTFTLEQVRTAKFTSTP